MNNTDEFEELGINTDLEDNRSNKFNFLKTIAFILLAILIFGFMVWVKFIKGNEEAVKEKSKEIIEKVEERIFEKKIDPPTNLPLLPKGSKPPVVVKQERPVTKPRPRIIKGVGTTIVTGLNTGYKDNNSSAHISSYKGGTYAVAGVNRLNPNLYIPKGSYIECTMNSRIVSSLSGHLKCILSNDVYSANGHVLLLEKGSRAFGSYKGGSVSNGVNRLFVTWEEIGTRNNIVINVNTGSTGQLGASGLHGEIDNHWLQRFGGATLLSLIDFGSQYATQKIASQNGSTFLGGNSNSIQSIAAIALDEFINIKPTFYKNHGDVVGIYLNKDLDFSKVYRLRR